MKTLIIGLFSLALLASGAAATNHIPLPNYPPKAQQLPQVAGLPAICNYTGGVIIIVVQNTGNVTAVACSEVSGKPITYMGTSVPTTPPNTYPVHSVHGDLGTIDKHKKTGDPDPCINWTVNGTSYVYCW